MAKLAVGDKAPAFALKDQHGKLVRLSSFKGKRVVVYFYPKADTPGCTQQSCNLRDAFPQLKKLKAVVVGISPDPVEKQMKFDDKYGSKFPLLADTDHKVAEAWGVWGEKSLYGRKFMGIVRSAFVVDEKGKLAGVFYRGRRRCRPRRQGPRRRSTGRCRPGPSGSATALNWSTWKLPRKWPASWETMLPTACPTKPTRSLAGVRYVFSDGRHAVAAGLLSTSRSISAVSSWPKLPGSIDWRCRWCRCRTRRWCPPTTRRLVLGWPNVSALSRLLRMRTANRGLPPRWARSARTFSSTVATMASMTASSSAARQAPPGEERRSGESCRTPGRRRRWC